jgi:hypothetical protein
MMMRLIGLMLTMGLVVGCNVLAPQSTRTSAPRPNATIDSITNTPPLDEATARATENPTPFVTRTPSVDCPSAPPPRLIVLERGKITENGESLNMREGPGIDEPILTKLADSTLFFVLDGAVCADDFLWYKVQSGTFIGWIAEGDSEQYYAEPYLTG